MYKMVKKWLNIPAQIYPFKSKNGAGDKDFFEPISMLCYISGSIKTVKRVDGTELVSNKQVYIDGAIALKHYDKISIPEGTFEITALQPFYRNGVVDMWVVYL